MSVRLLSCDICFAALCHITGSSGNRCAGGWSRV